MKIDPKNYGEGWGWAYRAEDGTWRLSMWACAIEADVWSGFPRKRNERSLRVKIVPLDAYRALTRKQRPAKKKGKK